MKFPEISDEEIAASRLRAMCEIHPVTVCECGITQFIHRLGCSCGKYVGHGARHAYMHNGSILDKGKDFSLLDIAEPDFV